MEQKRKKTGKNIETHSAVRLYRKTKFKSISKITF